jgi:hypothetical protein
MSEKHKPSGRQVIIMVSGGVADLIFKPSGVAVTLFDYDTDGVGASKDPDGTRCIIGHWNTGCKVVSNEHWPIIQQARTDITCRCIRQWKCPSCSRLIDWSYQELAEAGSPICRDCDLEMEILL